MVIENASACIVRPLRYNVCTGCQRSKFGMIQPDTFSRTWNESIGTPPARLSRSVANVAATASKAWRNERSARILADPFLFDRDCFLPGITANNRQYDNRGCTEQNHRMQRHVQMSVTDISQKEERFSKSELVLVRVKPQHHDSP